MWENPKAVEAAIKRLTREIKELMTDHVSLRYFYMKDGTCTTSRG